MMKEPLFCFCWMAILAIFSTSCAEDTSGNEKQTFIEAAPLVHTDMAEVHKIDTSLDFDISDSMLNGEKEVSNFRRVEKPEMGPAKAAFEMDIYDYGRIPEGTIIKHNFVFKNIGERPLEVLSTKGSCGCTFAAYSFLPILPNEKSEITARFDSKGKAGKQESSILVRTNGQPETYTLKLVGIVTDRVDTTKTD